MTQIIIIQYLERIAFDSLIDDSADLLCAFEAVEIFPGLLQDNVQERSGTNRQVPCVLLQEVKSFHTWEIVEDKQLGVKFTWCSVCHYKPEIVIVSFFRHPQSPENKDEYT